MRRRAHLARSRDRTQQRGPVPPNEAGSTKEVLLARFPMPHAGSTPAGLPEHHHLDVRNALDCAAVAIDVVAPPPALKEEDPLHTGNSPGGLVGCDEARYTPRRQAKRGGAVSSPPPVAVREAASTWRRLPESAGRNRPAPPLLRRRCTLNRNAPAAAATARKRSTPPWPTPHSAGPDLRGKGQPRGPTPAPPATRPPMRRGRRPDHPPHGHCRQYTHNVVPPTRKLKRAPYCHRPASCGAAGAASLI